VILADCFEWMTRIPQESVHAIVTDPPYGVKEYDPDQLEKRANGNGGIWRIPPLMGTTALLYHASPRLMIMKEIGYNDIFPSGLGLFCRYCALEVTSFLLQMSSFRRRSLQLLQMQVLNFAARLSG
jgi:hypothetical protein